jgi:hypothetical protein
MELTRYALARKIERVAIADSSSERVCPHCGNEAHESVYCSTCGLRLAVLSRLPTRAKWEADQKHSEATSGADAVQAYSTALRGSPAPHPATGAGAGARWMPLDTGSKRFAGAAAAIALIGLIILIAVPTSAGRGLNPTRVEVILSVDVTSDLTGATTIWTCTRDGSGLTCQADVETQFGQAHGTTYQLPTYDVSNAGNNCFIGRASDMYVAELVHLPYTFNECN